MHTFRLHSWGNTGGTKTREGLTEFLQLSFSCCTYTSPFFAFNVYSMDFSHPRPSILKHASAFTVSIGHSCSNSTSHSRRFLSSTARVVVNYRRLYGRREARQLIPRSNHSQYNASRRCPDGVLMLMQLPAPSLQNGSALRPRPGPAHESVRRQCIGTVDSRYGSAANNNSHWFTRLWMLINSRIVNPPSLTAKCNAPLVLAHRALAYVYQHTHIK